MMRFVFVFLLGCMVWETCAAKILTDPCMNCGYPGYANCIEVTSTADNPTITAASTCDGTLRWAILKANTLTGGTYIKFNLPGAAPYQINVVYTPDGIGGQIGLPTIASKVFIDGFSQVSNDQSIIINGGLKLNTQQYISNADYSIIQGLIFTQQVRSDFVNFCEFRKNVFESVFIYSSDHLIFLGNKLSVDKAGLIYQQGNQPSHFVSLTNAIIGTANSGDRNVFGNHTYVEGANVQFQGNCVGFDVNGINRFVSTDFYSSLYITNLTNSTIGGSNSGENNIIAGRIMINTCNHNNILGNKISVNVNGTPIPNSIEGQQGIFMSTYSTDNKIGGSNAGEANIICGTIYISMNSDKNLVSRNTFYISTGSQSINLHSVPGLNGNDGKTSTTLNYSMSGLVFGTSSPGDKVEVYNIHHDLVSNLDFYNYYGTVAADGDGNWSLTVPTDLGGTYCATATDNLNNTSEFSCYVCPPVSFTGIPTLICITDPVYTLTGSPAGGTFTGTGVSGNTFNPAVAGTGVFTISYHYGLNCPVPSKKINVSSLPKKIDHVLSATATTYSDAWPIDFNNTNATALVGNTEVENGTKALWRASESFVYVDDRKQTVTGNGTVLKKDGDMDNVAWFDHSSGQNEGCTNWRRIVSMTEYSPYNYELENKDVLGVRSAALYGYNGRLTTAVAVNTGLYEMAYDGMEEYTAGNTVGNADNTGNFSIYTGTAPTSYNKVYRNFDILEATDDQLTVDYPYARATTFGNGGAVKIYAADFNDYSNKNLYDTYNVASVQQHSDPSKCIVKLSGFTHLGIWKGRLSVPYAPGSVIVAGVNQLSIVTKGSAPVHSGQQALKVAANASIEQVKLSIDPSGNKSYWFSGWISVDNAGNYSTFRSAAGDRAIVMEFFSTNGTSLGSTILQPDNNVAVVEGWQKVEGQVSVPANTARMVMHFKTPSGLNTYWDDIRFSPFKSNMKTYVYNPKNTKLAAQLDQNNYATCYYYDEEGNLFLIKKETEKGMQTIQESFNHRKE